MQYDISEQCNMPLYVHIAICKPFSDVNDTDGHQFDKKKKDKLRV